MHHLRDNLLFPSKSFLFLLQMHTPVNLRSFRSGGFGGGGCVIVVAVMEDGVEEARAGAEVV